MAKPRSGAIADAETDPGMVGEDAVDIEAEPDRWVWLEGTDPKDRYADMVAFAERQHDEKLRVRLESALEGKGAFRRFRDAVHSEGLGEAWGTYSADRSVGRARLALAEVGIRVGAVP